MTELQKAMEAYDTGAWTPSWEGVTDILKKNRDAGTPPSEGQAAAVLRTYKADHNPDRAPVPTGEVTDESFEVVSVREDECKALLVHRRCGYKVWGEFDEQLILRKGQTVTLTGELNPSGNDPNFGFFRTSAEITPDAPPDKVDGYDWEAEAADLPF